MPSLRCSLLLLQLACASVAAFGLAAVPLQPQRVATRRVLSEPRLQATEEDAAPVVPETAASGKYSSMDLSDVELAEQSAKLEALAEMWKKREDVGEYEEGLRSGWGPSPERINGRAAMFFIVTGLITEYYTGQSLPQQVYTMLQTLSIIE